MAAPLEVQVVREDLLDRFLPSALKILEHPWDLEDLPFREDREDRPSPSYQVLLMDQVLLSRQWVLVVLSFLVLLSHPCHLLVQLSPFPLDDPWVLCDHACPSVLFVHCFQEVRGGQVCPPCREILHLQQDQVNPGDQIVPVVQAILVILLGRQGQLDQRGLGHLSPLVGLLLPAHLPDPRDLACH